MRESKGREGGGVSEARQRGWMYTRGRSQDLRDVTAKIRAIELFNPDGLSRSAPLSRFRPLCEPPALPLPACLPACLFPVHPTSVPIYSVALEFSVRLVASVPRPASIPLFFFSVAAYFFCLASLALARGPLYLFHPPPSPPPASPARSLFCHGALVLALSHSICHPPSFHHPSKPWSLTGDTDIHSRRYTYTHVESRRC